MAPLDGNDDRVARTAASADELAQAMRPVAQGIGALSVEVADMVGAVAAVRAAVARSAAEAETLRGATEAVAGAAEALALGAGRAGEGLAAMTRDITAAHASAEACGTLAEEAANGVQSAALRVTELEAALADVTRVTDLIEGIARQTNLLALNATIEAARAGDAGLGFAVVAREVKALASETRAATQRIGQTVESLTRAAGGLRLASEAGSRSAQAGANAARAAAAALGEVVLQVDAVTMEVRGMAEAGSDAGARAVEMEQAIAQQAASSREAAAELALAATRGDKLQGQAEALMQQASATGAETPDTPFIEAVQDGARRIAAAFEAALRDGETTEDALFDEAYQPIPGSAPPQVTARFTALTDRLLPPIQEGLLALDARVVFCAAVDRQAYLPTHNHKFSQPQRPGDVTWNTANARNRRVFDDRTGLAAARNRAPFLLQAYRRDMGGGEVALMKDCSAPIMVRGRHWGGLRLAYRVG